MLTDRQTQVLGSVVEAHLDSGKPVGSRSIAARYDGAWSPSTIRSELAEIEPALTTGEGQAGQTIFLDGTSRLLSEEHSGDIPEIEELMSALERRVALLGVLRSALNERSVF